ncbi:MAG: PKD domain-containing protein [Bacteroidales bacterium]|nr:PKD domain-containing protein [Bacteroidales bacterium]
MKKNKFDFLKKFIVIFGLLPVFLFTACSDDDDPVLEDPIATFQYEISDQNWLEVTFMNFSSNATSYSWNFDDGNSSTEENPTHVYAEAGNYDVTLTASNAAGASASFTQTIEIKDPDEALALLAGQTSKTWKLYRVDASMGVGPNIDAPYDWWFLENNGSRPCVYFHEFTFTRNMEYIFDDKGSFWGEGGIFNESVEGTCFEAIPGNMIGPNGEDLSAWLGATHQFEYVPSTNTVTLIGEGAWIGIPKVATDGEVSSPQTSVSFKIEITQHDGYDHMYVKFIYDWGVWVFNYASYSDPNLEPDVVEEAEPWGEDLPNLTPTELGHTFESETSFDHLGAIGGTSVITVGQDDPAGGETKVGMFERVAGQQWQEAQLRTYPDLYDIQFDNFDVAKIDIYIPSDTDFTEGGLQRFFVFGFADMSQTQEWWNSPTQFFTDGDDVVVGEWHTYTFDLTDVKEREDIDMIFLGIGGGGHEAGGIFYVRNLVFE